MEFRTIGTGSKGNGYILQANNGDCLLLEAGVKLYDLMRLLNFESRKVCGCIVTHRHNDHAEYVNDFLFNGLKVIANIDVAKNKKLDKHANFVQAEAEKNIVLKSFSVTPFSCYHDVPCLGYIIEHEEAGRILFATDTRTLPQHIIEQQYNQIIIECNYSLGRIEQNVESGLLDSVQAGRIKKSHLSLEYLIDILLQMNLRDMQNIILIHSSDRNSNRELIAKSVEMVVPDTAKVTIARRNTDIALNRFPF